MPRIYLDNAATSWPKPESVYQAVDRYQRENGAPAGRSGYVEAVEASRIVSEARRLTARLLDVSDPRRIVWAQNGTDALNLALHGLLRPGDHVVTTDVEHNSVLRPLHWLAEHRSVDTTYVPCDGAGWVDPGEIERAIRPTTRLIAVTHASNVTGAVQDLAAIAEISRQRGTLLLVDAAQTLGQWPLGVSSEAGIADVPGKSGVSSQAAEPPARGLAGVDLIAAPGHKGLLGPLGTGFLYVGPRAEPLLDTVRQGGTGTSSEDERQPRELPERFEPGNLNVTGLAGLAAGLAHLLETGVEAIREHHGRLTQRLIDGLDGVGGVRRHGPATVDRQVGVVSFEMSGYDPQELSALLDASFGVQCRAGLHCAPRLHRSLGTLDRGGLVRFSLGWRTTADEIDAAVEALEALG